MKAASDDLLKPLGVGEPRRASRWRLPPLRWFGFAALGALGAASAYVALVKDPLGGEPRALVPIGTALEPALPAQTAKTPPTANPGADPGRRNASEVETASGVAVHRPEGTSAPSSVVIRVGEPGAIRLNPAPDQRLLERTRFGALPKIGPDGARPSQVYARPAGQLPGGARPVGRVAVLVGGLGISQTATAEAIAKLPPAVTLAFAPYGGELDRHVARARETGHEVMLQVPMEPFDYPDNDPGPHTLTAGAKGQENLERLHWVMARLTGYVGLVNFMGAKITADEAALAPILRETGRRGLVFLDDGSSSRSLVGTVGATVQTPTARADAVLDGLPRADAIDKELARLEAAARERGLAIGTASALPLTTERIARWAAGLETRGILLVPVSAAVAEAKR